MSHTHNANILFPWKTFLDWSRRIKGAKKKVSAKSATLLHEKLGSILEKKNSLGQKVSMNEDFYKKFHIQVRFRWWKSRIWMNETTSVFDRFYSVLLSKSFCVVAERTRHIKNKVILPVFSLSLSLIFAFKSNKVGQSPKTLNLKKV